MFGDAQLEFIQGRAPSDSVEVRFMVYSLQIYVWQTGSRKQLIVEGHRLVTILPFNRFKKNSRVELP
jgi:hypothetical protein